jgi:hypothetical protein
MTGTYKVLWHLSQSFIPGDRRGCRIGHAAHDAKLTHSFLILDDDGILYFSGAASEESFAPLDYARESYGATEIWYLNAESGEWNML